MKYKTCPSSSAPIDPPPSLEIWFPQIQCSSINFIKSMEYFKGPFYKKYLNIHEWILINRNTQNTCLSKNEKISLYSWRTWSGRVSAAWTMKCQLCLKLAPFFGQKLFICRSSFDFFPASLFVQLSPCLNPPRQTSLITCFQAGRDTTKNSIYSTWETE